MFLKTYSVVLISRPGRDLNARLRSEQGLNFTLHDELEASNFSDGPVLKTRQVNNTTTGLCDWLMNSSLAINQAGLPGCCT